MKEFISRYAIIFSVLFGLLVALFFYIYPLHSESVPVPVLLMWIPELFGWEVFSLVVGGVLGLFFYWCFKPAPYRGE